MKRIAVIELLAGIGDCAHIEPVLRHILANGYDEVHIFYREDAVGIYKEYPDVHDHPIKARQLINSLCRSGAAHVAVGDAEHGIPGLHRAFQYAQKLCPALDIPMLDGEFPKTPSIPVTYQEQEWGRRYFRAGEDQLKVLFQVDSYRTSKSLHIQKANDILGRLATRNAAVAVISQETMKLFRHPNVRHVKKGNIRSLMSIAAGADVVLGLDSAPSWLALSSGTPTIVMFGATSPTLYGYDSKLFRVLVTEGDIPCLFCNMTTCDNRKCLNSIETDRIISAVRMLNCPTLTEWMKVLEPKKNISAGCEPRSRKGKLNLCIVLRVLARGGSEKHFLDIADALMRRDDVRVKIVALHEYDQKFAGNRQIYRVRGEGNATQVEALYSLLDDNLDAIICYSDDLPVIAGSNLPSKPVMIAEVQMITPWHIEFIQRSLPYLDAVVGCAEYVTKGLSNIINDGEVDWVTIPNYVKKPEKAQDMRRRLGCSANDFILGMLVRMVPIKGIEEAMRSLENLPENVKLMIGGTGPDMRKYQRMAERYRNRVHFLGWVDDTDSFYSTIDAALLPSDYEGNSTFVIESGLASLPMILTPVGNAPYLFRDRESALFVDKDPASIANAVRFLLSDRVKAREMGMRARECVSQYAGIDKMADLYYELCKKLIGRRNERRAYPTNAGRP